MFAISLYFSLIYLTVVCHVLHKRDNTYNKMTLLPYYIIFIYQLTKVITYAVFLMFGIHVQVHVKEVDIFFKTLSIFFWSFIAIWQFFIWDLITALVIFQGSFKLNQVDVYREHHEEQERKLIKFYKSVLALNSLVFIVQMVLPFLYLSDHMKDGLGLIKWSTYRTICLGLEIAFLILIVSWALISVSRLLFSVKNNYVDAYHKHKREYTQMAIVIVLSSVTMIFLNTLDLLS